MRYAARKPTWQKRALLIGVSSLCALLVALVCEDRLAKAGMWQSSMRTARRITENWLPFAASISSSQDTGTVTEPAHRDAHSVGSSAQFPATAKSSSISPAKLVKRYLRREQRIDPFLAGHAEGTKVGDAPFAQETTPSLTEDQRPQPQAANALNRQSADSDAADSGAADSDAEVRFVANFEERLEGLRSSVYRDGQDFAQSKSRGMAPPFPDLAANTKVAATTRSATNTDEPIALVIPENSARARLPTESRADESAEVQGARKQVELRLFEALWSLESENFSEARRQAQAAQRLAEAHSLRFQPKELSPAAVLEAIAARTTRPANTTAESEQRPVGFPGSGEAESIRQTVAVPDPQPQLTNPQRRVANIQPEERSPAPAMATVPEPQKPASPAPVQSLTKPEVSTPEKTNPQPEQESAAAEVVITPLGGRPQIGVFRSQDVLHRSNVEESHLPVIQASRPSDGWASLPTTETASVASGSGEVSDSAETAQSVVALRVTSSAEPTTAGELGGVDPTSDDSPARLLNAGRLPTDIPAEMLDQVRATSSSEPARQADLKPFDRPGDSEASPAGMRARTLARGGSKTRAGRQIANQGVMLDVPAQPGRSSSDASIGNSGMATSELARQIPPRTAVSAEPVVTGPSFMPDFSSDTSSKLASRPVPQPLTLESVQWDRPDRVTSPRQSVSPMGMLLMWSAVALAVLLGGLSAIRRKAEVCWRVGVKLRLAARRLSVHRRQPRASNHRGGTRWIG